MGSNPTRSMVIAASPRGLICVATMALLGCPLPATEPTQPPTSAAPAGDADPDARPAAPPPTCLSSQERFVGYGFAGKTTRAVAAFDLTSPDLDASITTLAAAARDDGHGLPIEFAFAASQWSWQVPLIRNTLADAGFAPAELVYVQLEDGTPIWAWPGGCDLDTLGATVATAWGLELKATPAGAAARSVPEAGSPFAYDLVALGPQLLALVPAGRATRAAAQLGAASMGHAQVHLGNQVGALDLAPVRVVTRGQALIDPAAAPAGLSVLGLRVFPDRLERAEAPG